MPWKIARRGSKHCVIKEGESSPVPGGCHDTRADAIKHQRALYAGEASSEEDKVMDMTTVWSGTNTTSATFGNVTVTISDAPSSEEETAPAEVLAWEGVLAIEGHQTGDNRYLMPGEIEHRDLPLTLMVQTVNADGHEGSQVGGKIEEIWNISPSEARDLGYQLSEEVPETASVIMGKGAFDNSEFGSESARMVEDQVLRGVSIDLAVTDALALDKETLEPLDTDSMDLFEMLLGDFVTGIKGKIMGATVVPFPAFEEASMRVLTAGGKLGYGGETAEPIESPDAHATITSDFGIKVLRPVLTASAAGKAPLKPPREWFEVAETDLPCPLTVTEDGRVYGHLALWGQCHAGFENVCQTPPRSYSNYQFFHLGEIETDEGDCIAVGKITVGTGHAPITYGSRKTIEHYDNTGTVAAFVRAKDGKRGIWLSGAIRSDLPAEKIRDLRANPPSGDWRTEGGLLELQGVLAVPIPGFPVPRSEARLVASGEFEEMEALIASGYDGGMGARERRRRKEMLSSRVRAVFGTKLSPREKIRQEALRERADSQGADPAPPVAS